MIPIGGGFSATSKDWPSLGSVVEYLSQHSDGWRFQDDYPITSVCPIGWVRSRKKGQYRRPGQYGGLAGEWV